MSPGNPIRDRSILSTISTEAEGRREISYCLLLSEINYRDLLFIFVIISFIKLNLFTEWLRPKGKPMAIHFLSKISYLYIVFLVGIMSAIKLLSFRQCLRPKGEGQGNVPHVPPSPSPLDPLYVTPSRRLLAEGRLIDFLRKSF